MSGPWWLLVATAALLSLALGVALLVRYARTRRRILLILGLFFTFIVPGLAVLACAGGWLPMPGVVYAPPPDWTPGP